MSLREIYDKISPDEYYKSDALYVNEHADQVRQLIQENHQDLDLRSVLDLACGDGLVSQTLLDLGYFTRLCSGIVGCDPFRYKEYSEKTQLLCYTLSFKDIVERGFVPLGREKMFTTVICSFGLHLCPKSMLPDLTWRLSEVADTLVVISPSKFPDLGTPRVEKFCLTPSQKRVHYREYKLPILWYNRRS